MCLRPLTPAIHHIFASYLISCTTVLELGAPLPNPPKTHIFLISYASKSIKWPTPLKNLNPFGVVYLVAAKLVAIKQLRACLDAGLKLPGQTLVVDWMQTYRLDDSQTLAGPSSDIGGLVHFYGQSLADPGQPICAPKFGRPKLWWLPSATKHALIHNQ